MLLTDSEIMDINQNAEFDSAIGYARKIESAVLEKLKVQEPIGHVVFRKRRKAPDVDWAVNTPIHLGMSLYSNPPPPDDVVRDAERLDWLMNFGRMVICDKEGCYTYTNTSGRYGPVAKTKREAIDAAMKEMK